MLPPFVFNGKLRWYQVETHSSVIFVPAPHVWQLTPHPRIAQSSKPSVSNWRARQISSIPAASILVGTITVHIKPDSLDREILEVTRLVREKCGSAFKGSQDVPPGELTVVIHKGMEEEHHYHHSTDGCSHTHSNPSSALVDSHSHSHSGGVHSHSVITQAPTEHTHSHQLTSSNNPQQERSSRMHTHSHSDALHHHVH